MPIKTNPYPLPVEQIRSRYYPNLASQTYLDHAGTTIYPSVLLDRIHSKLSVQLLGNPHSQSSPARKSEDFVAQSRLKVLEMFHADTADYDVAFTLNCTQAVRLAATLMRDNFPEFAYCYNMNCHTSLIGFREYAAKWQAYLDIKELKQQQIPTLVSWPGQSNLNGQRFPLREWTDWLHTNLPGCYTLFDSASLATSSPPDLSDTDHSPDFVTVSFYKIFGLPDIGALVFKKKSTEKLIRNKKYFGGGTLDALSASTHYHRYSKDLHTILEDGTVPFHDITALTLAIDVQKEIYGSFENIAAYLSELRAYAVTQLTGLRYKNGAPMLRIHEDSHSPHGPIIALSLLNSQGDYAGYYKFEKYACARNISIRTGALCNIGGLQRFLLRLPEEIERGYNEGHKCGDEMDILYGKPTGAIRVSLGAMTLKSEIDTLVEAIEEYLTRF